MKTAITRFFRSVAGKMFSILSLCMLTVLLFLFLLNNVVFLNVYEQQKRDLLTSAYIDAAEAVSQRKNLETALSPYHTDHDMSIVLWTAHHVLYSTASKPEPIPLPSAYNEVRNGAYTIVGNGENGLVLYGKTMEGIHVSLRVSLSDAQANAALSNRFLGWGTLGALAFCCIVLFLVIRAFSHPVKQLSLQAQQMAKLNFSARYPAHGNDEIAELGYHLNCVSETMEQNLSALKTANARLQNDMQQTTRQNEARSRFIRNVSHELKTPIALIQTYAEGLHENVAANPADREFYCTVIEDEAQKLSQIIAKLTTLMQLEAGNEELSIEHFDVVDMVSRLLQRYAPLFVEKGVTLPVIPEQPLLVWGDALLIEQVMTNYLTNALHHVTESGRICITFEDTPNNTLRIAVFNTGNRIPEEDLPHIWESFYKVDKAHTRSYGGTGIGLSVVAAILQAHRMPYSVRNLADGVEFSFELQC